MSLVLLTSLSNFVTNVILNITLERHAISFMVIHKEVEEAILASLGGVEVDLGVVEAPQGDVE